MVLTYAYEQFCIPFSGTDNAMQDVSRDGFLNLLNRHSVGLPGRGISRHKAYIWLSSGTRAYGPSVVAVEGRTRLRPHGGYWWEEVQIDPTLSHVLPTARYWLGDSGFEPELEEGIFTSAHPFTPGQGRTQRFAHWYCTRALLLRYSGRGVEFITHPNLTPTFRLRTAVLVPLFCIFVANYRETFTSTILVCQR